MIPQKITNHRVFQAVTKRFYQFIWVLVRLQAKKPVIEVLYEDEDDGSVVSCCHGPAYIEPEFGYIISEKGYIVESSMTTNGEYNPKPFGVATPSPFDFFKARKNRAAVVDLDAAVSLRHFWEWNYYHFYFDVLGKLELFQTAGLNDAWPLVIGKYADDVSFVRPLIDRGKFRERRWVSPVREYVKADRIILCRTRSCFEARVAYLNDSLAPDRSAQNANRRLFLNRSNNRRICNLAELRPILEKYKFDVVDAAEMSIEEQISLFSSVRYLIANHGAGTTNILFRGKAPLSLLELHHENYMNYDHKRMCEELGYQWDQLDGKMGSGIPAHADFSVCPKRLEEKIVTMLRDSS